MTVATFQGCALAEPGGPWRLTFVLGRLENFSFFIEIICWAPWISQVQSTGLPSILVRAQPCIWNIIDTSTILSTQGWINSIATSHSKMGSVLKVWTKPRRKRRQRGWNWHTFQPTCLPPTMVRMIILKTDTSRVIIKYRPTKTNPKYFLPENCHLNGPI